jgi:hypothetical protein
VTAALSSTLDDFAPETIRALPWPPTRRRRAIPLPIGHRRVGAVLRGAGRYREAHVLLDQLADAPLESTPKANLAHVIAIPLRIRRPEGEMAPAAINRELACLRRVPLDFSRCQVLG